MTNGLASDDRLPGRLGLGLPDVGLAVDDLALQVRLVDVVELDDAERADPGRGQVEQRRAAEAAGADHQHLGVLQPLLPVHPDVGDDQVPGVAADLVDGQLGAGGWRPLGFFFPCMFPMLPRGSQTGPDVPGIEDRRRVVPVRRLRDDHDVAEVRRAVPVLARDQDQPPRDVLVEDPRRVLRQRGPAVDRDAGDLVVDRAGRRTHLTPVSGAELLEVVERTASSLTV